MRLFLLCLSLTWVFVVIFCWYSIFVWIFSCSSFKCKKSIAFANNRSICPIFCTFSQLAPPKKARILHYTLRNARICTVFAGFSAPRITLLCLRFTLKFLPLIFLFCVCVREFLTVGCELEQGKIDTDWETTSVGMTTCWRRRQNRKMCATRSLYVCTGYTKIDDGDLVALTSCLPCGFSQPASRPHMFCELYTQRGVVVVFALSLAQFLPFWAVFL